MQGPQSAEVQPAVLREVEDLRPRQLGGDEDADRHADDAPEHGGDHTRTDHAVLVAVGVSAELPVGEADGQGAEGQNRGGHQDVSVKPESRVVGQAGRKQRQDRGYAEKQKQGDDV